MVYRVVANEALKHLQWIVVRDETPGRPIMVGGPYADERVATMHCDAMNREHVKQQAIKSPAEHIARFRSLINAGWKSDGFGFLQGWIYPRFPTGRFQ
jgi:hypothetical protein